jgi:diguanylate cyclase (GGDEF)-like protein
MQGFGASGRRFWRRTILVVLCGLATPSPPALALNPERQLDQYTRQIWTQANGLPQATVTGIVQGQDQFLYVATFGGLLRFDGIRFKPIPDAGGCGNRFSALAVDEGGSLWAGVSRGGLCRVRIEEGRQVLQPFKPANGVPITGTMSLTPRRGGGVWAVSTQGLFEVEGQKVTHYGESHGIPSNRVTAAFYGAQDELMVLSDQGPCILTHGRCRVPDWASAIGGEGFQSGLYRRNGDLIFGHLDKLFRVRDGQVERIALPDHLGVIRDVLEDRQGNLWLGSSLAGIKRLDPNPALDIGPGEDLRNARALFEDHESNLWVGYSGDGLERLSDGNAYGIHLPNRSQSLDVLAVVEDARDGLWVAVPCTGLARLRDDEIEIIATETELGTGCIWSLLAEPDGQLWIGTYGEGLAQRSPDGELRLLNGPPTHEQLIRALARDPATGDLLVGSDQGVYRYSSTTSTFDLIPGTAGLDVHFVTAAPDGTVWVGSRTGAMRIGATEVTVYDRDDGLASDYVRAIRIDPDGVVWLGTYGGGLYRLDGDELVHFGIDSGLPDAIVSRIVEDDLGRFWMTGNLGVVRVAREQLEAYARGEIERVQARLFNARDGMPNSETNGGGQPAGLLRENGEFWAPTINGLAVFDTRAPDQAPAAPPVLIERVVVDGQELRPDQPIELSATARNLEIHYAAPAFRAPEQVRFRYRLDRFDERWTDAGDRRVAYFPIIPPGSMQFRVTAARGQGDWNVDEASVSIYKQPTFRQTALFVPTLILGAAGITGLLFWVSVASMRRREQTLKNEVRKRTAELERLATMDGLTGVPNRRAFDQRLEHEWARLRRSRDSLSVLLIDVDHFKAFNDRYGHQAGDECLKTIASTLSAALRREIELLARIGGEEFGVILPETTAEAAEQTAERLRRTIAKLAIAHEDAETAPIVTVSIGGASVIPAPDRSTGALFESADQALYSAKSRGRNQITIHSSAQ